MGCTVVPKMLQQDLLVPGAPRESLTSRTEYRDSVHCAMEIRQNWLFFYIW